MVENVGNVGRKRGYLLHINDIPLASDLSEWHAARMPSSDQLSPRQRLAGSIRKWRRDIGFSQKDLADAAHTSRETIIRVEAADDSVKMSTINDVLAALGAVRVRDLKTPHFWQPSRAEMDADEFTVELAEYKKHDIPVVGEGDASPSGVFWNEDGQPIIHVDEWMSRPDDKAVRDPSCYAIVIRGDSMEPMIRRGMRAIISPNIPVGEGDLAYVHLKTGERLVKMVHKHPNGWLLESFNREYPPRFVDNSEVSALHRVAYVRTLK
jgi:phage repressor protein C with HTH and peptisase S24 domain